MRWKYRQNDKDNILSYFRGLQNFINDILLKVEDIEDCPKVLEEVSTDPRFDQLAYEAARKIITFQAESNARSWREAARKSSKGLRFYKSLFAELKKRDEFNNLISDSAYLIKTLPLSISKRIVKKIARLGIEGKRSSTIAEEIKKYIPEGSKASAQLIARTQVAKTYAAITETRAKAIGVKAYIWHTVGGPRVRDSHRHMNDVIVLYADPPSPEVLIHKKSQGRYHAGGIYNCRCYEEPILDLDDVSWPHKVYYSGKITKMSRKSFTNILG